MKANLLIFPEFGLNGADLNNRAAVARYCETVPPIASRTNPCLNPSLFADRPVLLRSSCMARNASMVISVNMCDLQPCNSSTQGCPADKRFMWNAEVIFNEQGEIVANYAKTHVWYILTFNAPKVPDIVTYNASFGVQFGIFTCFDIMFESPAVELVKMGVKHFIYSVAQGAIGEALLIAPWAKLHNVTLNAANLGVGSSGVFIGGTEAAHTIVTHSATDKTYIATGVPF